MSTALPPQTDHVTVKSRLCDVDFISQDCLNNILGFFVVFFRIQVT